MVKMAVSKQPWPKPRLSGSLSPHPAPPLPSLLVCLTTLRVQISPEGHFFRGASLITLDDCVPFAIAFIHTSIHMTNVYCNPPRAALC
jgi:hypothetical protein